MIGLIVATVMLLFGIKLETALLAFIGFQLMVIAEIDIRKWKIENIKRKAMSAAFEDFAKGLKEGLHGTGNEKDSGRDTDGNGD